MPTLKDVTAYIISRIIEIAVIITIFGLFFTSIFLLFATLTPTGG